MARGIGDESALRFADGFYRGLAFGEDYATAFRLGCAKIDLAALPDALVPHFTSRGEDLIAATTTGGGGCSPARADFGGWYRSRWTRAAGTNMARAQG
jgi:hypothetical protein